jgi:hypothetical protein
MPNSNHFLGFNRFTQTLVLKRVKRFLGLPHPFKGGKAYKPPINRLQRGES